MKDLQDIQAALQRLTEAQKAQESEASKALMGALRGVEVALTEIIGMREAENEGADDLDEAATVTALGQIVAAIGRLKLEAPAINLEPRFDVPQAPAPAVTFPPINLEPRFEVPQALVHVVPPPPAPPAPPPWKTLRIEVDKFVGGVPHGFTVTRQE